MRNDPSTSTYVFDHTWRHERERMRAIEALFDRSTERILTERGLGPGWHCLEVGCGAGGVANWMAEQAGPSGRVLAVDLDTRFIDASRHDNLEVRQQDIVNGELEKDVFDLVHARAVLEHIPQREIALERMIAALKAGGWLVVEDVDFGGAMAAAASRYVYPPSFADVTERILRAIEIVFAAVGAEASSGPRLPGILQEAGLTDIGGETRTPILQADPWVRGTVEQLSGRLVDTGLVSEDEIHAFLSVAAAPTSHYVGPFMVAAWGRRAR
jgi:SAM-dependent methyltransferase